MHNVEKMKRLVQRSFLASLKTINALVDAVFTAIFVPCETQTLQSYQMSCLFVKCFSFKFAAYQPLQRCQISCANKQQVEKMETFVDCSLLEKF